MRQTDKYYWAKRFSKTKPEVVYLDSNSVVNRGNMAAKFYVGDFYWISEEPIEEPKISLKLKDNHYYVIDILGNIMFPTVLGRWSSVYECFSVDGYTYGEATVKVVGGPFTVEELVQIKPIE
jgi:predicted cation transporter